MLGRWQAIIDEGEKRRDNNEVLPSGYNVQVARAYAEIGDLDKAASSWAKRNCRNHDCRPKA